MNLGKATAFLATVVVAVKAQTLDYPAAPTVKWVGTTTGIFNDNGVYNAPDDSIVVGMSRDCVVRANDAMTGNELWTFVPIGTTSFRCFGGITFKYDNTATPYLVFAVVDNPGDSINAST